MKFDLVRQTSIALENQPGALHAAAAELARHHINVKGISVLDSIDQGIVRFRTSDPVLARKVLEGIGLKVIEAELVEFDLPDQPGQLAEVCRTLAEGGVNIDYAYGTSHRTGKRMRMLIKASPLERAKEILKALPE